MPRSSALEPAKLRTPKGQFASAGGIGIKVPGVFEAARRGARSSLPTVAADARRNGRARGDHREAHPAGRGPPGTTTATLETAEAEPHR
jgi:hypothetical protein